jgi:hypothetical protein
MEPRRALLVGIAALALPAGCAGAPAKPSGDADQGATFHGSMAEARAAAEDAIAVFGFALDRSEPSYVEGHRPRAYGGGETIGVWLEPVGPDRTRVLVDTARTFVGYAGQKRWDADVLAEMKRYLGEAEASPAAGR